MKDLQSYLDYESGRERKQRILEERRDDVPKWYSTIFHEVTEKLNLSSLEEAAIFGIVEGLSRGRNVCVINLKKLSQIARCPEEKMFEVLRKLEVKGFVERGQDYLKRQGWKLTAQARDIVEPVRKRLNAERVRKHLSPKSHN